VWDINEAKDRSADPRTALAQSIGTFLGRPHWWATFTFRRMLTTKTTAVESLRSWLRQWARALQSNSECRAGLEPISRLVWCVELQLRGTAHIHALMVGGALTSGPHCARCFRETGWNWHWPLWRVLKESWYAHHGIARIFPFDERRGGGVAGYVAKYMYKSSSDHGFWESGKDF